MPPAPLPRMSGSEVLGSTDPSAWRGDVLVPVLQAQGGSPDPVALATWHMALASSTAIEVPHDLFALWVFPASGGAVLLGPSALAQDRLEVPLPGPQLLQDELYGLEEKLRRAQYGSVIAIPVRHEARDVGVMLLGSFTRGAFAPQQAVALYRLAGRLAPMLTQLADLLPAVSTHTAVEPLMTREELPEHLARAACESASGADLVRRVSGILYPLLPHDRLEIVVPGAVEESFVALSGHSPRRRWSGGGRAVAYSDLVNRFGGEPTLLLEDLNELESGSDWPVGNGGVSARSLLGARLEVAGRPAGYLLLGSVAGDAYRPDDEDTLALAALLLAPRVLSFRPVESDVVRPAASGLDELPLVRAAELLAGTAHLGNGLTGFAAELHKLLPHQKISLHLRRGEDEIIELDPAAPRPFADVPAVALDEFEAAAIVRGEREWLVLQHDAGEAVLVPMRVAGRTIGVLGVLSEGFDSPRSAAALARQFADVLAPHLELLRRASSGMRERTPVR